LMSQLHGTAIFGPEPDATQMAWESSLALLRIVAPIKLHATATVEPHQCLWQNST